MKTQKHNKSWRFLRYFYSFLAILALYLSTFAHAETELFEVYHLWSSESEKAALDVVKSAFQKKQSINWQETDFNSIELLKERALPRVLEGYPPNAIQWHPNSLVQKLYKKGLINTLNNVAERQQWEILLPNVILEHILIGEDYISVPTSMHIENIIWYNNSIYRKLKLSPPNSWQEFIAQAQKIKNAGFIPIASSDESWTRQLMFNVILNSISPQTYVAVTRDQNTQSIKNKEFTQALKIFEQLRNINRDSEHAATWHEASQLFIKDRAAIQFMGDWVNKEFQTYGKIPGIDYECILPPVNQQTILLTIDGFVFPMISTKNQSTIFEDFAETILSPDVQLHFTLKKGALPIRNDIPTDKFDTCARKSIELIKGKPELMLSTAVLDQNNHIHFLHQEISDFWESDISTETFQQRLYEELKAVGEYYELDDHNK